MKDFPDCGDYYGSATYRFINEVDNMHDNFKLIDTRVIKYDKPILIVYNPVSGKKVDIRKALSTALD